MTADFSRRVPLRTGTPTISLPNQRSQSSSTQLPIISLSSFTSVRDRARRSSITGKSSTTSSFMSFDGSSQQQSTVFTSIPRRTIVFPHQPPSKRQERNTSPRRSHHLQLGRFLTYLRLQSLAKEKIRRQREEEKKPRFLIRPARSPFHLILEPLERDIALRTQLDRSSIVTPRVEIVEEEHEEEEEEKRSTRSSLLNTPRNSLADE